MVLVGSFKSAFVRWIKSLARLELNEETSKNGKDGFIDNCKVEVDISEGM